MRRLKSLLAAVLIMVSSSASAQFIQNNSSSSGINYDSGWNEFTFDLGVGNIYNTEYSGYDGTIYGFSFNYARGIHLNRSNGLTLRPSAGIFGAYQDSYDINFSSLTLKVDFGYHFIFPNSSISLFPYIGLTTRTNVWGQKDDEDLFDDWGVNRFQIGGRSGFDAHFRKFILGLTYERDFSEFDTNVKIWYVNLKLGWCF